MPTGQTSTEKISTEQASTEETAPPDVIADIKKGENLFSLPAAIQDIITIVSDESSSLDDLAKAIQRDPGLTAAVLKLANSSYYGRISEVRNLSDAAMTLGNLTVKTIALTASILNPRHVQGRSGVDPVELVANSISVGSIAHQVACAIGYEHPQDALTVGLLHDVGALYFIGAHPERYASVVSRCADGEQLLEAERDIFGVDHAEAGRLLVEQWHLPDHFIECLGAHHSWRQGANPAPLQAILQLSVIVAGDAHIRYRRKLGHDLQSVVDLSQHLSLDSHRLQEIVDRALAESFEIASKFGLDVGPMDALIAKSNRKLGQYLLCLQNMLRDRDEVSAKMLADEHKLGALEARVETVAALAHIINNAAMVITGQAELLGVSVKDLLPSEKRDEVAGRLSDILEAANRIHVTLTRMSQLPGADDSSVRSQSDKISAETLVASMLSETPLTR